MKYIIVDLDDTLLTSSKEITIETLNYFNKLKKQGYIIVINTARSFLSTKPFHDILKPNYSILNGGTQIIDTNYNILYKKLVDRNTVNYLINEIKKDKSAIKFSIESESGLYTKDQYYLDTNPLANYYSFTDDFFEDAYKVLVVSNDLENWKKIAKINNLEYEAYYGGNWFRLSKSNKYLGNLKLFELLNDDNPKDYVFGDDTGDIEMILKAYHGVFMCNSRCEVLDNAINITDYDMNNDGIVKYLKKRL